MGSRYYRLVAGPLLYFCLGCFWIKDLFVTAAGVADVRLWSPGVIMIGLGALLGGLLQLRFLSTHVGYAGAVLLGLGFVGAGFTSTPAWHYFTLEILLGFGSGVAYSAGFPLVARWFPDRVGLAIGVTVAGYVPGGIVGGRIALELIEMIGWRSAAQLTGSALVVSAVIAIRVLQTDAMGTPPVSLASAENGPGQMIRRSYFPSLWLSYALGSAGAIIIYTVLPGYLSDLMAHEGRNRATAASHLMEQLSSVANMGARILAGWLCDLLGGFKTLRLAVVLIPLASILALAGWPPEALLAVAFIVLAGYGAMLAIYPILTATAFGLRHLGANYAIVFNAWAAGYVVGKWLGPKLVRSFAGYGPALYGALLISLVAFWLAVRSARVARPPQ